MITYHSTFPSTVTEIKSDDGGDTVYVVFADYRAGAGSIFITCWNLCWSAWFTGMGEHDTIRKFVDQCGEDYLSNKLSDIKTTKRDRRILERAIGLVKELLVDGGIDG